MLQSLTEKVLDGQQISQEEAMWLMTEAHLDSLCECAHRITETLSPRRFDMCSIINAKSGRCPENCKWCAQSSHYSTGVEEYPLVSEDECLRHAAYNEKQGVSHFSIVTSGKRPSPKEIERICKTVSRIKKDSGITVCASLGLADYGSLVKLHEAGVTRYHCNLETAPSFFGELCTTHTSAQKTETLEAAKRAGMEICSGGILGMGETPAHRVELAMELRKLGVTSVPLNILHPIKGTPLESSAPISDEELLRTIAVFRFILPHCYLRFAGGRGRLQRKTVEKALYTGINSAIVGDLLTTVGSKVEEDKIMIQNAGYGL